jgi:hypothetical protein
MYLTLLVSGSECQLCTTTAALYCTSAVVQLPVDPLFICDKEFLQHKVWLQVAPCCIQDQDNKRDQSPAAAGLQPHGLRVRALI